MFVGELRPETAFGKHNSPAAEALWKLCSSILESDRLDQRNLDRVYRRAF